MTRQQDQNIISIARQFVLRPTDSPRLPKQLQIFGVFFFLTPDRVPDIFEPSKRRNRVTICGFDEKWTFVSVFDQLLQKTHSESSRSPADFIDPMLGFQTPPPACVLINLQHTCKLAQKSTQNRPNNVLRVSKHVSPYESLYAKCRHVLQNNLYRIEWKYDLQGMM